MTAFFPCEALEKESESITASAAKSVRFKSFLFCRVLTGPLQLTIGAGEFKIEP